MFVCVRVQIEKWILKLFIYCIIWAFKKKIKLAHDEDNLWNYMKTLTQTADFDHWCWFENGHLCYCVNIWNCPYFCWNYFFFHQIFFCIFLLHENHIVRFIIFIGHFVHILMELVHLTDHRQLAFTTILKVFPYH